MASFDLGTNFTNHVVGALNTVLPRLPNALFDLLVGILVIRVLERVLRFIMKYTSMQPALRDVMVSVISIIMWIFLSVTLLGELGFSGVIYFFTGSVAALGIAMAAGGSTLIADIIAGIFLARDNDFNVGDEVIVGERPTLGTIESMDARRTRLRDDRGILHIIPNSVVERKEWIVISKHPEVGALVKATKAAKRFRAAARKRRSDAAEKAATVRESAQ
ncbi:MAG: mechanosensitive ion channel protein MscS [Patescibacteria group bacterium]|nr:mechanosensitive ion channel protein MscS [Patescibacteria group bacterium]